MVSGQPDALQGVTLDGRFRLERLLGEGGMGRVYEATQLSVGRRVAVKVILDAQIAHNPVAKQRFLREARLVASLTHASIVRLIDFGEDPTHGVLYLAMDLVRGVPLSHLVRRGPIAWPYALRIVARIAEGLVEAHAAGIVHRDLKPDNVMLAVAADGSVQPLILDFGVALPQDSGAPKLTDDGAVCGTPHYMAPEQASGDAVGPAADLYALGTMLFEMLTGTRPFQAPHAMAILVQKIKNPPPRLVEHLPSGQRVPPDLERLVSRLLATEPSDRPASGRDVIRHVAQLLGTRDLTLRSGPDPDDPFATWSVAHTKRSDRSVAPPTWNERERGTIAYATPQTFAPPARRESASSDGDRWAASNVLAVVVAMCAGAALVGAFIVLSGGEDTAVSTERGAALPEQHIEPPSAQVASAEPPPVRPDADAGLVARVVDAGSTIDAGALDAGPDASIDALSAGCGQPRPFAEHQRAFTITHGGVSRRFVVYLPRGYDGEAPHRVLLLFHKQLLSGEQALEIRGFRPIADRENLVVIAPDARRDFDAWIRPEDPSFVRAALEETSRRVCLDLRWIYAVGHGAGEHMVERLSCEMPLSAMAGSGHRPAPGVVECAPADPAPFLHVWGTRNQYLPRAGGTACNLRSVVSHDTKIGTWKRHHGCTGEATRYRSPPHGECWSWTCEEAPFVSCEVDGGHEWPGENPGPTFPLCNPRGVKTQFPYAEEMWRFLAEAGVAVSPGDVLR